MSARRHALAALGGVTAVLLAVLGAALLPTMGAQAVKPGAPRATVTKTVTATTTVTQTVTATATVTETVTAQPTATTSTSSTPTATATATPTAPAGGTCTEANAFTNWNGERYIWDDWGAGNIDEYSATNRSQYYADSGLWNGGTTTQHSVFCLHDSWYAVVTNNDTGDGSVKTYPNTHMDYYNWANGYMPPVTDPDSDPATTGDLYSTFAHQNDSQPGAYNWSYDIWLNGVGWNGTNTELMIWTDYKNRVPWSRSVAKNITVDGRQWDLWQEDGGGPGFQYLPTNGQPITSGNFNLSAFFRDLAGRGKISATAKLGQVDYGVETVSTNGQPKRFDVTDFSVSIPPMDYYH